MENFNTSVDLFFLMLLEIRCDKCEIRLELRGQNGVTKGRREKAKKRKENNLNNHINKKSIKMLE